MERTVIKKNFLGFENRVASFQNVFRRECPDADLNTDVLEFFSGFQNELVGKMMDGSCTISHLQSRNDVLSEDLLCYLDTQWNLDPLLMSANCTKTCYRVTETTNNIDLSTPEAFPKERRTRCSSNSPKVHPASSKVKKNLARKSELKSKRDQSVKITKNKSKVNSESQGLFHLPLLNKKPVLQAEKQPSIEMSGLDSSVEFLGTKYKLDIGNADGVSQPIAKVPMLKSKSEPKENISISESSNLKIPFKESSELKFETPMWFRQDQETHTFRPRLDASVAVPKSQKTSKVGEQSTACESSIKIVHSEEKFEPKIKVPTSLCFDSVMGSFGIAGLKQDSYVSKQSPEAPICKLNSKVKKKKLTCESSIQVLPSNEKYESELKVPAQVHFDPETLTFRIAEMTNISEKSSDACTYKPKSNVEKMLTYEHSTGFSLKDKTESDFKLAKQSSTDSQNFKIPERKGKQTVSDVECASVENLEETRQPLVEMPRSDSHARKISLKKRKQEYGIDVPVETPEEARKRLAIVLLRIAGKY